MRPRSAGTVLLVLLVSVAGCTALSAGEPPTVTVENRDDTRYRLTVFTLHDVDEPTAVTFRATTEDGDRRDVGLAALQSGAPYANVSLADDRNRTQQRIVGPTGNTTMTLDGWESGSAWGYIVERVDSRSLAGVDVVTCERGGQTAHVTIVDGFRKRSSSTCS